MVSIGGDMMRWLVVLLLLFQPPLPPPTPPPPVLLYATFVTSTSAIVWWQQPPGVRATCLLRQYGAEWPAGWCWQDLEAGPMRVDVPGTLTDPRFRPASGDRYDLWMDGVVVGSAVLGQTIVYTTHLPLLSRQTAPAYRVRLAVVRA